MFVLSQFEDDIFYICAKKNVTYIEQSRSTVKYKNGVRYHAQIIAENADRRVLEKIRAEKYMELEIGNNNNDVTEQANKKTDESPQMSSSSQCDKYCHRNDMNDTYSIYKNSSTNTMESNSVLMGLLEEIVPAVMRDDVSFSTTEILAESTNDVEISTTDPNDLPKALTKPFIFSTPIEDTYSEPYVSLSDQPKDVEISTEDPEDLFKALTQPFIFSTPIEDTCGERDVSVFDQPKENSLQPRCLEYSSQGDEYVDTIQTDSQDMDYEPSEMYSDINSGNNELGGNTTYVKTAQIEKSPENNFENINIPGKSTRDEAEMFVRTATGKRAQDRKSYCMYCKTMQSKFVRHLENKHKDIESVKKFSTLPKGNPERLSIIDAIRKQCMFDFNTNNLVNDGELLVCRRPSAHAPRPASHFIVCQNCKGFFSKDNIRHHAKRCFSHDGNQNRKLLVRSREILGRIHMEACNVLRKDIFPVLREDDIVRLIRYDRLVILYGNKLCAKHGDLQHQHDLIRADLRLMGRFLKSMKLINPEITDFASVYRPKFYDSVILAIRNVGGYDEKSKKYAAPSTAYAIGSILKKIAHCFICDCIKREDILQKGRVEDFLKLLEVDLGTDINKAVIESQTQQRRRKKIELPPVSDIQKLHDYLKQQREKASKELTNKFNYDAWLKLAESTLTATQLFNRRRAGEIERILIEDFDNHEYVMDEELKNMSIESQTIAKNYVRFTIRGKLNRTVPVLLSTDLTKSVRTILKHRQEAGVPPENPYIFGLPGSDKIRYKYLRACVLMRKFAGESKVTFPSKLTGTTLRKHVATACINLNLSENEVADVAQFMGHAEKIHRSHYRQPIVSREIMKMSKILEMAQQNPSSNINAESESDDEEGILDSDSGAELLNGEPGNFRTGNSAIVSKPSTSKGRPPKTINEGNNSREGDTMLGCSARTLKKRSTSPYGHVGPKKRWSIDEKKAAFDLYAQNISNGTYPSLKRIQDECSRHPILQARNPCVIKTWISNQIKKRNQQRL